MNSPGPQRWPIPGTHGRDGGFSMFEPTEVDRENTWRKAVGSKARIALLHQAAVELCAAYSLAATFGGADQQLGFLIQQCEREYVAARNSYLYAQKSER